MRGFLSKTLIALAIALGLHAAAGFLANGTTDEYYLRFTTERQRSMILGGSRAAQGLHPDILNARAGADRFEGPLYGFAFTIAHSPYGPAYLHAIEEKLDPRTRNGLFILQVDPWLLSSVKDSATGQEAFNEANNALGVQWTWNMRPNYEYLARYWDRGWGALGHWPQGDPDTSAVLMPDGRLDLHVDMSPAMVKGRTARKLRIYREEYLPGRQLSDTRFEHLRKIVRLLREHGTVCLVRLPVGPGIASVENTFAADLPVRVRDLAQAEGVHFIDLDTIHDVGFTDGNHLDLASGRLVSEALARALPAPAAH